MGFKKENYTLKGICVCVYFLLGIAAHPTFGQIHCPVRVDFEPRESIQSRSAITIEEVKFPFFQHWEDLSAVRLSDDEKATLHLPTTKRSTVFKGKNLGFSIPNGASISGIELIVEGYSTGEGSIEGQMVRLLDSDGNASGNNLALHALPLDRDWENSSDSTDFIWRYGSSVNDWGIHLTESLVNDPDFGYALQVRNKLNKSSSVFIDHVQMIVYYTPLYEVCSTHACVPFYIDDLEDPLITYEWYIPEGFELISDSEEDPEINIGASYAEFGEYEICVEAFYKNSSLGLCCRKFNYLNCNPATLSGQVFLDENNNGINNSGENGIQDIVVNLYANTGVFIASSITAGDGTYEFSNLDPGQFYVEFVKEIDSLLFTNANIGLDSEDSDVTGAFGDGTTDLFELISGDTLSTVDAGLVRALSLGDFVWEDLNGDGIQQDEEPGIAGVIIKLTDSNNVFQNTTSNSDGFYTFDGLIPGDYTLEFESSSEFIPTTPNNSSDDADSDLIPGESIILSYSEGGIRDTIDAGYFRFSTIGDFVWEDLNGNGIQDELEPGIENVTLELMDESNAIVQTVNSDSLGQYEFSNIVPGVYYIRIQTDAIYGPTEFQFDAGNSNEVDSDVMIVDGDFTSPEFTVTSNSTNLSLDFGFVEKPALVGGFTFLDGNNNGQYDQDEIFVENISISLFDDQDNLITTTLSDVGGYYEIDNVAPGFYYIVFELNSDDLFTFADLGDDLSDSDVASSIVFGSTNIFELMPDEENLSISAGYQKKPKVGDYVWLDENSNGLQDEIAGLNDVLVELFNDQNELIQTTLSGPHPETSEAGYYQFESLDTGNYYIKIPVNEQYDFTSVEESLVGQNSVITNANGIGTSNTFNLIGNRCNEDIDAGYAFKNGNIQGEVWIDANKDGIQDPNEEPISNVIIELFNESGELQSSSPTNEEGQYFFNGLDAGNYYLIVTPTDRYRFTLPMVPADTALDSDVTGDNGLGSTSLLAVMDGVTLTNIDAGLVDGALNVKGLTWIDADGDGQFPLFEDLLANVKVELFDLNDSLLATTFTDQGGGYSLENILAGQYYIVFTPDSSIYINTIANQGGDENLDDDVTSFFTTGSTDTIDLEYFQLLDLYSAGYYTFSSIGDQVFIDENENGVNDNEPGLDNVTVELLDADNNIISTTTTAQGGGLDSGYYLLENISPGTYRIQFTRPLFYQFVAADQGGDDAIDSDVTDISNNIGTTKEIEVRSGSSNLTIDAGVFFQIPMESSITGSIWDDENTNGILDHSEGPIANIMLTLENQIGDVVDMTTSDVNGVYLFENLTEGFYTVKATLPSDRVATFPNIGTDDTIDSDFIESPDGLATEEFFLGTFEDLDNIDLGLVNTLRVGDFVWEDLNNNGVQDVDEPGIENIEITITSENGVVSETVTSDTSGFYQFVDLPAGNYTLCAGRPSGFHFAKSNVGTDLLDSDVDSTGCTEILDLTAGGTINDLDIGLTQNGSIQGIAFVDLNGNGILNLNDPGLDGIPVNLHSASGELLATTLTSTIDDIPGVFEFDDLKATDYYLVFEYSDEYIITDPDIGDDQTDSDITGEFGVGSTGLFSIPSGGMVTSVNGGAYLPASIGDQVWMDENEDGIQDENEDGVANIQVIIFRSFGIPFDTTFTDEEGFYNFENLKQGLYFIQFVIPQEFAISPSDQGIDDDIDSDADNTGKTPLISLAHGANLESVDCGIYSSMASLRSLVWNDIDGDGMRQINEARIPGIRISLFDDEDNLLETTETNSLGLYAFQHIPSGEYKVLVNLEDTDYLITSMNMTDDDYHDSDVNEAGESEVFTSDQQLSILSVPNIDAGLYESGGIISEVWEDKDADGQYDLDEFPLQDIDASLYTHEGIFLERTTIDPLEGTVKFNRIKPGTYFILYEIDRRYVNAPSHGELQDDYNSDVTTFEGFYVSPRFQVLSNEIVNFVDAGFYLGSTLNSTVWYDTNKNGIQDDESDIPTGIYATIFDHEGTTYGTKGINAEGQFNFMGIPKGEYYIKYYASENLQFTNWISHSELNSDVDHSNGNGTTGYFEFEPYQSYTHIDAGIILERDEHVQEVRSSTKLNEEDLVFDVHPNPAANYVRIKIDKNAADGIITIHNSQNQLAYKGLAKDIDKIDLSEFHPGIYYIKYESKGKSITKKLLKIQ
ncbi:MAG: SdrD B-like domain-containing protein [Bacteroidota bacterium]